MRWKQRCRQPRKHCKQQRGGLLTRYDFAYAGRDTVNQVRRTAPGLIKNESSDINNTAKKRINKVTSLGQRINQVIN